MIELTKRVLLMSVLREAFTERNIAAISISRIITVIGQTLLYQWWALYLLELGATEVIIGILAAIQSAVMLGIQLPGGIVADRIGRKKVIVYGALIRVVAAFTLIFSRSWQQFFLGLIFNRMGSGLVISSSSMLIAESLPQEKRGTALGAQQLLNFPLVFMPMITGFYVDLLGVIQAMRTSFYIFLIATVLAFVIRFKSLRETLKIIKKTTETKQKSLKSDIYGLFGDSKNILIMLAVASISSVSIQMAGPFLTIYAVNVINLTKTQWGTLTSITRIIGTVFSLPAGILSDRFGRRSVVFLARFFPPFERLGLLFLRDFNQLLFLHVLIGIGALGDFRLAEAGSAPRGPAWTALLADLVPAKNRGKVSGLMATVTGIVNIPSSIIGGIVWSSLGPDVVLISSLLLGLLASFTFLLVEEPTVKER